MNRRATDILDADELLDPARRKVGKMGVFLLDQAVIQRMAELGADEGHTAQEAVNRALVEYAERRGMDLLTGERKR